MGGIDQIKRIWVCGPPLMNEEFDKALERLKVGRDKYEIL